MCDVCLRKYNTADTHRKKREREAEKQRGAGEISLRTVFFNLRSREIAPLDRAGFRIYCSGQIVLQSVRCDFETEVSWLVKFV